MSDRFRTSDGVELSVADSGPTDTAVTVVMLHGWTEDHTVWSRVIGSLGDAVRVLAPDHRGHGGSDPAPRGSATIDQLADDVAELIAERAPSGRIVLVGHSLGGMTMMALAERHHELVTARVAGAVFISTSAGSMHDVLSRLPAPFAVAAELRRRRSAARRRAGVRPESGAGGSSGGRGALPVRSRLLSGYIVRSVAFGDRPNAADVRATVEQAARTHRGSAAGLNQAIGVHDRRAALRAFQEVPAVVLVGERDRITPPEHARIIADELPGAEFVRYPRAGHMLPFERAVEVASQIRRLATG